MRWPRAGSTQQSRKRSNILPALLDKEREKIAQANQKDIDDALRKGLSAPKVDRLRLNDNSARRNDRAGSMRLRSVARSRRRDYAHVDAPQWAQGGADENSARSGRYCLRVPAECDDRCSRPLHQGRECRGPAGRFRSFSLQSVPGGDPPGITQGIRTSDSSGATGWQPRIGMPFSTCSSWKNTSMS